MRKLEDCKAEVFRRSEERIKERKKKRNRVLACCIPLCLLLVAGGLYIRPLMEPVDEISKSGGTNRIPDRVTGGTDVMLHSSATSHLSVTVTEGTGSTAISKSFTDVDTSGDLYEIMAMYFDVADYSAGAPDGADGAIDTSVGTAVEEMVVPETGWDTVRDELAEKYGLEEKPADYTLVFRNSAGEETELRLYENNLYNENNGCVVTLSDAQLTALKAQLEQIVEKDD